jgi:hypothetical protein
MELWKHLGFVYYKCTTSVVLFHPGHYPQGHENSLTISLKAMIIDSDGITQAPGNVTCTH